MRAAAVLVASLLLFGCAERQQSAMPDFRWPASRDALPDEETAKRVAIAIFQGQFKVGDAADMAKRMMAFRYRTSDLAHDPKGDAWFVEATDEERARFDKECKECLGGELFTMALSAHDARVLEFYVPQ